MSAISPKVSIVIPVFDPPMDAFHKCLHSCLNQSLDEIEIILVNDGSTRDEIAPLLKDLEQQDHRVRVFHQHNQGGGMARAYGVREARGSYILVIDSDDSINTTMAEKMYDAARCNGADIVVCAFWRNKDGKQQLMTNISEDICLTDRHAIYEHYARRSVPAYATWNKMIRASLAKSVPFRRIYFAEDMAWTASLIRYAGCVYYLNEPLYHYNILPAQVRQSKAPSMHTRVMWVRKMLGTMEALYTCVSELKTEVDVTRYYKLFPHIGSMSDTRFLVDLNMGDDNDIRKGLMAWRRLLGLFNPWKVLLVSVPLRKKMEFLFYRHMPVVLSVEWIKFCGWVEQVCTYLLRRTKPQSGIEVNRTTGHAT